jgi:flavin-dependent dehydrogenase
MSTLPKHTQVLVIGGGPAGSTAATLLAREGFDVTLIEKVVGPRYHIGESLIPTALEIFDLLGIREKVEAYGFQLKTGAYFEWGAWKWGLDFGELNNTYAFQVRRADFDQLLLGHAKSQGVKVFEGIEVRKLAFDGDRPLGASWFQGLNDSNSGEISFDFLVDASGRSSLMATRYLQNRRYHNDFQNIAIWGYWKDANIPKIRPLGGTASIALADGSGWFWLIPLHDGTLSVGLVIDKTVYKQKKSLAGVEDIYLRAIADCPYAAEILAPGELVTPVRVEQDYSYTADSFAGSGYFLLGDAACFLDPLLSTGVHLATFSATLAAASLASVLRNQVTEKQASAFYDRSFRHSYLRLLVFVATFYDQVRKKGDCSSDPHALLSGIEDLSKAEGGLRRQVIEEMSKLLAVNTALLQNIESTTIHGETHTLARDSLFTSLWQGLFSWSLPEAEGLQIVTKQCLGLIRASEPSILGINATTI